MGIYEKKGNNYNTFIKVRHFLLFKMPLLQVLCISLPHAFTGIFFI